MRRHPLEPGTRLVVASHNPGKVWEINQLIAPYGLDAVSAGDLGLTEPEETETTFAGNARLKAVAAAQGSGLPALADDSGLEVAALDGAPGVYSARWAGPGKDFEHAMRLVYEALEKACAWAGPAPTANFISVLCLAWPDGSSELFEGRVDGTLVWPPRGGNGFGYDPMFTPNGSALTFGEMEPAEKYAISHRTRAFAQFKAACLGNGSPHAAGAPPAGPDFAAFEAAARNLSTRAELARFVSELARSTDGDLAAFLSKASDALQADAATKLGEPAWRTVALALLAAMRHRAGAA